MQKILIVVDMQNDFVTGPLGSEAAQVAAKNIAAHINEYDTVIFTRDTHGLDITQRAIGRYKESLTALFIFYKIYYIIYV